MVIKSKRLNPLSIKLDPISNQYILLGDYPEIPDCDLKKGCLLGTNNYGFNIITPNEEVLYYTQCPIITLEIKNNLLKIHEEGKTTPWKFSLEGGCINAATFLVYSRRDVDYLNNNLGVSRNLLERVNREALSFKQNKSDIEDNLKYYTINDNTLTIKSSLETINRKIFYNDFKNNQTINTIIIENGIKNIEAGSFSDFLNLYSLYIPESVENISLYISKDRITQYLQVFYKNNVIPIIYSRFITKFFGQKVSIKEEIDKLYNIFEVKDNVLHIKKVSKTAMDALSLLNFDDITTIIIEDDLDANKHDKAFLNESNNLLHIFNYFPVKKIIYEKKCSLIVPEFGTEYIFDGKPLILDKYNRASVYPQLTKLITTELINLLNIPDNNYETVFKLMLDKLSECSIYVKDETTYSKTYIRAFMECVNALNKYGSINESNEDLNKLDYIKKINKMVFGDVPLIINKTINDENIDLTEFENCLLFQKTIVTRKTGLVKDCKFNNTTINMPPLSLLSSNSFFNTKFNNVDFKNITPDSWQPTFINGKFEKNKESLGSGITFKNSLYLELGRECNATCSYCMNKSFPHEDLDFNSVEKSLKFLAPYLNSLYIGGGEPTLKIEQLYKIKKLLENYSVAPTIISNGTASVNTYNKLWNDGINIGISRHAIDDEENEEIFGTKKVLSSNNLEEMINKQSSQKLTLFVTCMPEHIYSAQSILLFIYNYHRLGCNIIFQSPMLDKTLGNKDKIYDLEENPSNQMFLEAGDVLKDNNFTSTVPIIGTAGYRLVTYKKSKLGTISFKEYISKEEYEETWPKFIKRTFDLSIKPSGDIFENWNSDGKKLTLSFKK
ncbi:MAG: hypothetical protein PHQ89_00325 [Bacilli bacterium]|nr:hypothetical protein [Bacilli bacterium]